MKRRKSVVIELTSLLDVIFIMLFMVMNDSRNAAYEAQSSAEKEVANIQAEAEIMRNEYSQQLDEYEKMLTELESERENIEYMQNRIDSYQQFDEYAEIISVYILDSGYKRSIRVADGKTAEVIDFDSDNISYGGKTLESTLNGYIDNSANPVFIVFSYDSNNVYIRDYNMVSAAITNVQGNYDNVYIKFNDTAKES